MSNNLIFNYIPGFFKSTKLFKALLDADNVQLDKVDALIADCINQLYVNTATWGLTYWEQDYGLEYDPSLTIEQRRNRIKAKLRGTGKVTGTVIKRVASSFNDDQAEVTFDGTINIELTRLTDNALNLKDLQDALEEIIPSHLDYTIGLKYSSIVSIKSTLQYNITSELLFCGEFVCGAYPEENLAKEYLAGAKLVSVYSTAEQVYKLCGTFISGDNTEITNDAAGYSGSLNMAASYSTALQTYPVCGELICGEGLM